MSASVGDLDAAARLAIAALIGAGVGLEREWSGQTTGPSPRFAGLRTFLLLGLTGGIAGLILETHAAAGATLIAGAVALTVAAYVMATGRAGGEVGGTTEAAALAVIGLGALAGSGSMGLAAGAGSVVVLALSEKARLHWLVRRLGEPELRATLQFAVLALVVLPILPEGPFGGIIALRPRSVWMLVLVFSGLSFAAYLIRRALGSHAGSIVTGLAGGLVSSTAVTLEFSRRSRREPALASALAFGTIGACTILIPRVIVLSAILNAEVAISLARILWLPALLGAGVTALGWRRGAQADDDKEAKGIRNPLRLGAAVQMAVAFQVAMSAVAAVRDRWGTVGIYATAGLLGLTDVDALTMSMSRVDASLVATIASRAIAIGILANTLLKLSLSLVFGAPQFRRTAGLGLAGLGIATALALAAAWG